jgi:ribosome biogenesis protein ERB1
MQKGQFGDMDFDPYEDWEPFFSRHTQQFPVYNKMPNKAAFVPSKWELMKVTKIMQGLKDGSIKPLAEQRRLKQEAKDVKNAPSLIWSPLDDDLDGLETRKGPMHIAAPKLPLPGHAASYRPPEEYLLSPEEEEQWRKTDPEDRELDFLPKQYDNLRSVGAYPELVKDRFERCLDLYLCPRSFKRRLQIDPESLVPKLPSPKDLRPFPTAACIRFGEKEAHGGYNGGVAVRCLAPSLDGQWLASGDDNGVLRLWEVATARCVKAWRLGPNGISSEEEEQTKSSFSSSSSSSEAPSSPITLVCWNPNPLHHVLAVAAGNAVFLVATGTGGAEACEVTDALLHSCESEPSGPPFAAAGATEGKGGRALSSVTWAPADDAAPLAEGEGKKGKKKGKRSKEDEEEVAAVASGQSARRVGVRLWLVVYVDVIGRRWCCFLGLLMIRAFSVFGFSHFVLSFHRPLFLLTNAPLQPLCSQGA